MTEAPKYTVVLTGAVTADSPLCTNPPGVEKSPSRQPRQIIVRDGNQVEVPYFPAAGLRGKLRRLALKAAMRGNNEGLDLDSYYLNAVGGVKDSGGEDQNALSAAVALRERNPVVGLFGANSPWVNGSLSVGHLLPIEHVTCNIVTGVRLDDMRKSEQALTLLSTDVSTSWREQAYHNQQRSKKAKQVEALVTKRSKLKKGESLPAEDQSVLERLEAEIKDHIAIAGSVSTQLPLAGYETIPQGTLLESKIVLTEASGDEVGLFLATLQEFSLQPVIGSRFNQGNGLISADWSVKMRKSDEMAYKAAGHISLSLVEGLKIDDPALAGILEAFKDCVTERKFELTAE